MARFDLSRNVRALGLYVDSWLFIILVQIKTKQTLLLKPNKMALLAEFAQQATLLGLHFGCQVETIWKRQHKEKEIKATQAPGGSLYQPHGRRVKLWGGGALPSRRVKRVLAADTVLRWTACFTCALSIKWGTWHQLQSDCEGCISYHVHLIENTQ